MQYDLPATQYDLIVVGGSFAGLSAAIQAGRARRNVLVIDAGQPRNRFAEHSHGFLGQDGRAPGAILDDARRQLLAYPTARVVAGLANKAAAAGSGFEIMTDRGETFGAARLVLATGVRDILPDVPGLPSIGERACCTVLIAMVTRWPAGRLACWQPARWQCIRRN